MDLNSDYLYIAYKFYFEYSLVRKPINKGRVTLQNMARYKLLLMWKICLLRQNLCIGQAKKIITIKKLHVS